MPTRSWTKWLTHNPESVEAFQKYASYLRGQEKFDDALVKAKRVLKLKPEDPEGLWLAGKLRHGEGAVQNGGRLPESRHQGG